MNIIDTLSAVLFGISVMILFILTLYVIVEPQHLKKVQNNKQYYAFSDAFNLETLKQNLERHEPIEPIKKEISKFNY